MKQMCARQWLGAGLALLALIACDRSTPVAAPRSNAPRDWSATHGKETGAPTPDTPKQQPPNQRGEATTR
jgi:hypothetical protein